MLGRELDLEPQVVVTVLQVSEEMAGALADLFDQAAVQLAALLHACPPEALHLGSIVCVCTSSLFNVKTVLIEGVCGAFTATPPSAAGACPGISSRRSLNVSLRKRFHYDSFIQ